MLHSIGDLVLVPSASYLPVRKSCPDCLGSGVWPTTIPSGETTVLQCPRCWHGGFEPSTGWVEEEYQWAAWVEAAQVRGIRLTNEGVEVQTARGTFPESSVFRPDQEMEAQQVANSRAAENALQQSENARRRWLQRARPTKAMRERFLEDTGMHDTISLHAHYNRRQIRNCMKDAVTASGYKSGPMTAGQLRAELEKAIEKGGLQ